MNQEQKIIRVKAGLLDFGQTAGNVSQASSRRSMLRCRSCDPEPPKRAPGAGTASPGADGREPEEGAAVGLPFN
jgi:hypothetical protein